MDYSIDDKSIAVGLDDGIIKIFHVLDWTKTSEELEHEKLEAWRARWKKD